MLEVIHTILPSQYLRGVNVRMEPHKRLMAAVLQTVLDDRWGSVHRRVPRLCTPAELQGVQRATAYVASRDRAWPFSFENLCEALGLDATALREELQKEPADEGTTPAAQSLQQHEPSSRQGARGTLSVAKS